MGLAASYPEYQSGWLELSGTKGRLVKFSSDDVLLCELRLVVDRYFEENHLAKRGHLGLWVKAGVIAVWFAASYAVLVFVPLPWFGKLGAAVSLGFAAAGVGFNIMHDGGHGSFSKSRLINRWLFRTLDVLGGSSYLWSYKHNRAHHTYTNVEGHDTDIDAGAAIRLSPHQPLRFHHRFQHVYAWLLYGFLVPKWVFIEDFAVLKRGRIGVTNVTPLHGQELAVFAIGKVVAIGLAFGLPLFLHSPLYVLACYAVVALITGVTLSVVFQLAHVVPGTDFLVHHPDATSADAWSVHQLQTTADFAPNNRLLSWYVGGLNFQIEHHLFPRISHVHYAKIAPFIRDVALRHDLPYLVHGSLRSAVGAHFRHLRYLGRPITSEGPALAS